MNAPISQPAPEVFLSLKWTVSHARATHGGKVLTLTDHHIWKTCRTIGGHEMEGTVFAEWLAAVHPERLQAIAARAFNVYPPGRGIARADVAPGAGLYGMTRDAATSAVRLDGACGLQSMLTIAEAAGLSVRKLFNNRGRLGGFVVTAGAAVPTPPTTEAARAGHPVRLHHVHVTNDRTGRSVQMTAYPATHAEACTMMGKIRKGAGRRVHLVEVAEEGGAA